MQLARPIKVQRRDLPERDYRMYLDKFFRPHSVEVDDN